MTSPSEYREGYRIVNLSMIAAKRGRPDIASRLKQDYMDLIRVSEGEMNGLGSMLLNCLNLATCAVDPAYQGTREEYLEAARAVFAELPTP